MKKINKFLAVIFIISISVSGCRNINKLSSESNSLVTVVDTLINHHVDTIQLILPDGTTIDTVAEVSDTVYRTKTIVN